MKAEGWHLPHGAEKPHYFVGSATAEVRSLCGKWKHKGEPTAGPLALVMRCADCRRRQVAREECEPIGATS